MLMTAWRPSTFAHRAHDRDECYCAQENERSNLPEGGQREGKKRAGGNQEAASETVTPQAAAQGSCLDALWVLLKEVPSLLEDSPAAAAHTLAVLLALWQASTSLCSLASHFSLLI